MLEPMQILWVALAVLLAFALQGTVGFGAGMLAIPLMLWAGLRLPETIAMLMTLGIWQTAYSTWRYRRDVPWASAMQASLYRGIGLPVGVLLLAAMVRLGPERVKQVVGVALALAVLVQWLGRVRPRAKLGWYWLPAAGLSSGVLAGAVGMGGPPIVLWAVAHRWPSRRTRSFLWATFLMVMPMQLGLLWWKFGPSILIAAATGVAFLPLGLAGVHVGHKAGNRLSSERLRVAVFVVLLIIAATSVVGPLL